MKITFLPKNVTWEGTAGSDLMSIAAQIGIIMDGSCGGKGICGKCEVLIEGKSALACQYKPQRDLIVEIPSDEEMTSRKISMSHLPESFTAQNDYSECKVDDERAMGLAFDVGTTTVVGALHNLRTAECLGMMARTNPQGIHGADVISRIQYVGDHRDRGLTELHNLIINCMDDIASRLLTTHAVNVDYLKECVVCGNTTMSHLVAGKNPVTLASKPFAPAYRGPFRSLGRSIGFDTQPNADFYILPCIAGHVGSDITADLVAMRKRIGTSRTLMIDIGTNGEIYGRNDDREIVCSTAAGPAFEGATIKMGMRAAPGAIERVSVDDKGLLQITTIGNVTPVGICGSGIIDSVALLVSYGIIEASGRFARREALASSGLPEDLLNRICRNPKTGHSEFVLYRNGEENDVVITQRDVREVQLGKGALSAGTTLLLRDLGMAIDDVDHFYVAGAFGNYIDLAAAQHIGLIPSCDSKKVEFVGNAAIVGTSMCLLSRPLRRDAERLVNTVEHIELAEDDSFESVYLKALSF